VGAKRALVANPSNCLAKMACSVCGEHGVELYVNETWAGSFHSACCHASCLRCIRNWVNASLQSCRAVRQLRIQCFHPDCHKFMPQKLVLHASHGARLLADAIDKIGSVFPEIAPCALCGMKGVLLRNENCDHHACEHCWDRWAAEQLPFCRANGCTSVCLHQDCVAKVSTEIFRQVLVCGEAAEYYTGFVRELQRLEKYGGSRFKKTCTEPGPCCHKCGQRRLALLVNDCGCAACEDCWLQWSEKQIGLCRSNGAMALKCIQPSCKSQISAHILDDMHNLSRDVASFSMDTSKELKRLQKYGGSRMGVQSIEPGPCCQVCGEHRLSLLVNDCGCAACEGCWLQWSKNIVGDLRSECALAVMCIRADCSTQISHSIWEDMCILSHDVKAFHTYTNKELKRLQKYGGKRRNAKPTDPGPWCQVCGEHRLALLVNDCGCAACEQCWLQWTEKHLARCSSEGALAIPCMRATLTSGASCGCSRCQSSSLKHAGAQVGARIWEDMCILSPEAKSFSTEVNMEVKRLQKFALTTRLGAAPIDPAPLCCICQEQRLFLLQSNDECRHAACEECWARWAEVHIEDCLFHRTVQLRCIGAECSSAAAAGIWAHACTRSEQVARTGNLLKRRRRLQENPLFPAHMQVNCPLPRCVGLGYLGFDTVMCFICEHQWNPEDAGEPPPADVDMEEVMGVKVKRCPKCQGYIEKNGGCDHMTCRHRGCGHEFWWSTLKPYRN